MKKPKLSPSLVLAIIAVVMSATGSAWAAVAITSAQIRNGTIQVVDLSPMARQSLKGNKGPQGAQGPQGVQGPQGLPGPKGEVTGGGGVAGVTKVESADLPLAPGASGSTEAYCPAGMVVVGTGFFATIAHVAFVIPYGTFVGGAFHNDSSIAVTINVYALCAPDSTGRRSARGDRTAWKRDVAAFMAASSSRATSYRNCAALNRVYPHGVGRRGARDSTSGTPVTNFTRNNAVYNANTGRDRDNDKIACEKR